MFVVQLCLALVLFAICHVLATIPMPASDCPCEHTLLKLYATESDLQLTKQALSDARIQLVKMSRTLRASKHQDIISWRFEPYNQTAEVPDVEGLANYSNLMEDNYPIDRAEVEFSAYRLRPHGDELWLTTAKRLYIYSPSLVLKRSVPLHGVEKAMSLVPTSSGQLVVADNNEFNEKPGGLHLLHANGSHIQTLETGRFSDVVIYNQQIYAYRTELYNGTIYVYSEIEKGVWQNVDWFTLGAYDIFEEWHGTHALSGHRMAILDDSIYVSDAYNSGNVHQYNITGEYLSCVHREALSTLLCSTDTHGNLLVASQFDYRLVVYNTNSGRYSLVKCKQYKLFTYDAVVSASGKTIWVLQWDSHASKSYIIKYTPM